MEEKEIVTNDASKQKEASNTEEVKQLVDKSNAEEETAENAEKETTENAEEESTENAEEETTDDYDEEEKEDYDEENSSELAASLDSGLDDDSIMTSGSGIGTSGPCGTGFIADGTSGYWT
ncbi:hypothetical protein Pcinc_010573 [Petrolisthes cinctipes]|uniref:Uncharacterized protein n=1 Tax=Petrolisthes cinctipes TaxID=88211 RepID=A0AAE1G533_PETCI|nr:hypothetical protein Pcinc_010573 [Petrolisthes cinctipes]